MKEKLLHFAALLWIGLAAQTLSAADLSGKWIFSFRTPDGTVDRKLELAQDGQKLTAKFDASDLEGDYFARTAGYSSALAIKGKLDGEGLAGDATWDVYDLTFTAKRAN